METSEYDIILPIFNNVDPRDVKHEGRYGKDVVKKWEEALANVGQISGWDSRAIEGEGRFVRSIVQDILVKLRTTDG